MEPWTCIYMYLERKLSLGDTPLITVYPLWMHPHKYTYRYLFISKRQPNYRDYRATLRNKTTSRTLYLRTRNVISSWTERMCARDVSDIMSVRRPLRGFRVHYAIIPAAAYRYNVHRMRITWTRRWHGQPARIRCTRKGTSFLSLFRSDVMRFRYICPFRKIVIRRRFTNSHRETGRM